MYKITLILSLLISTHIYSQEIEDCHLKEIIEILKTLETNNNPNAIGDNGKAYGVLQIHKVCVKDVNRVYKTNYSHKDAFIPHKAEKIALLYLKLGVKVFKKKHNKLPSDEDLIRMYNGSVYNGYKKVSTKKYYNRYLMIVDK